MRFELRFINSPELHVEILTPSGTYIGAHAGAGIQERPADYCRLNRERRYRIPCSDSQSLRIQNFAHSKIGTLRESGTPRESGSQFVLEAAKQGGICLLDELAHLVTPETLHLSPLLMSRCTYDSETGK